MSDAGFRGIFPYLVSPVDGRGRVMDDVLARLVDHLVRSGVHGLTPLGSTGEFAYLNWAQKRRIVEVVLEANAGRVPVVSGVAAAATASAIRQARDLEALGIDGILAIMNSYFPVPEARAVSYFTDVARAVSCPVVVYTNPRFQKVHLSAAAIEQMVMLAPNIQYLKDASPDTGRLLSLMNRLGDRIQVFSASSHIPLCLMLFGGAGWMAGPACLIPSQSVQLYELAAAKKWDAAVALQRKLWHINHVFAKHALAPCIKGGLALQGFPVGDPLPPQAPLTGEARDEVRRALVAVEAL